MNYEHRYSSPAMWPHSVPNHPLRIS